MYKRQVQEYSTDSAAKEKDGDVGWDKLSSFDTAYQEALDGLEKDQVSGLVTSSFGIHIIKCTDVYTAPEELTSTDQIPAEFVEQLKSMVSQNNQSQAYQAWLDGLKEAAEIVVNDMPEGLPYDVDMTKYQTSDGSVTNEDGSTTVTNDDGTTTTTYLDGSTKTMDAEGNVISETPATSGDGTSDGADAGDGTSDGGANDGEPADNGEAGDGSGDAGSQQPAEAA